MKSSRRRLVLLLIALAASGTLLYFTCAGSNLPGSPQQVVVLPGSRFGSVTDTLVARGVVAHRTWFTILARVRGLDRLVQAGTYEFRPGESAWRVLQILKSGKTAAIRFTVPEGSSLLELARLAQNRLGIPAESVLAAARDTTEGAELGINGENLEGFLFPETYQVPVSSTGRELVRIMAHEFAQAWKPAWDAQLSALGLTRRQAVILASIVEGEARVDSEREIIAGVYQNRIRTGMPLQADPTVQYAIELKTGRPKPRLFEKDYLTPSPYNTYLHPGLPPGPINSPGLRSLEATLYPAHVPYLYFVASPDGHHIFSRTYNEHLRAVAQAHRQQRN